MQSSRVTGAEREEEEEEQEEEAEEVRLGCLVKSLSGRGKERIVKVSSRMVILLQVLH